MQWAVSGGAAYESDGRSNVRDDCLGRQCFGRQRNRREPATTIRSVSRDRLHDRAFCIHQVALCRYHATGAEPFWLILFAFLGRQSVRASGNRATHGVLNTSAPTW